MASIRHSFHHIAIHPAFLCQHLACPNRPYFFHRESEFRRSMSRRLATDGHVATNQLRLHG